MANSAHRQAKISGIDGIVKVHAVDAQSKKVVEELVEGISLREVIKLNPHVNPADLFEIIIQVAGILHASHAQDIIHADLKPENILIGYDSEKEVALVKVTDPSPRKESAASCPSGVQNTACSTQGTSQFSGTPKYMSPEQIRSGAITPKTDVYGLAAVLYELLTGKTPEGRWKNISDLIPNLPFAEDLNQTLLRALVAPEDRYASAAEFQQALEAIRARHFSQLGSPDLQILGAWAAKTFHEKKLGKTEARATVEPKARPVAQSTAQRPPISEFDVDQGQAPKQPTRKEECEERLLDKEEGQGEMEAA